MESYNYHILNTMYNETIYNLIKHQYAYHVAFSVLSSRYKKRITDILLLYTRYVIIIQLS